MKYAVETSNFNISRPKLLPNDLATIHVLEIFSVNVHSRSLRTRPIKPADLGPKRLLGPLARYHVLTRDVTIEIDTKWIDEFARPAIIAESGVSSVRTIRVSTSIARRPET